MKRLCENFKTQPPITPSKSPSETRLEAAFNELFEDSGIAVQCNLRGRTITVMRVYEPIGALDVHAAAADLYKFLSDMNVDCYYGKTDHEGIKIQVSESGIDFLLNELLTTDHMNPKRYTAPAEPRKIA